MNAPIVNFAVLQSVQSLKTSNWQIPATGDAADNSHLQQTIEAHRIKLLIDRDGMVAARAWVERTLCIYRKAVNDTRNWAATGDYKPTFEASIHAFEKWLTDNRQTSQ